MDHVVDSLNDEEAHVVELTEVPIQNTVGFHLHSIRLFMPLEQSDKSEASHYFNKLFERMSTSVSVLIEEAFDQALRQDQKLYESWIEIATQLGGRVLPFSMLAPTVHNIGALDLVLRCMENETKAVFDSARESGSRIQLPMAHWYQNMLSQIWVSEIYEVFRLLKERELVQENDTFLELENHLRLLRIPFDKHELAKDRKSKNHPKLIKEYALIRGKSSFNVFDDLFEYDSNNKRRVYSLKERNTPRGSIEWEALDLDTGEWVWLERLSLSERVLGLFLNHNLVIDHR